MSSDASVKRREPTSTRLCRHFFFPCVVHSRCATRWVSPLCGRWHADRCRPFGGTSDPGAFLRGLPDSGPPGIERTPPFCNRLEGGGRKVATEKTGDIVAKKKKSASKERPLLCLADLAAPQGKKDAGRRHAAPTIMTFVESAPFSRSHFWRPTRRFHALVPIKKKKDGQCRTPTI